MSKKTRANRTVSLDQLRILLDFMGQHTDFATGTYRTLEERYASRELWSDLTRILNNSHTGAKKTEVGWSKYWSVFKNKLKNKVTTLKKAKRLGNVSKEIHPLSKLEKRALVILGPNFAKKTEEKITIDLCNNSVTHPLPTVMKLETSQETTDISYNPIWEAENEGDDQMSEVDVDGERSINSNEESKEESDNSNEPIIHGIYPKWLVALEKKRAEADYIRSKADEHRASAAAKNAKAALLQADALKKLAEAAQTQADAIMKIAVAIENRKKDDMLIMRMG